MENVSHGLSPYDSSLSAMMTPTMNRVGTEAARKVKVISTVVCRISCLMRYTPGAADVAYSGYPCAHPSGHV